MRLAALLLAITCLQVSASGLAQKVTLHEQGAPLRKIFKEIKQQTGYVFFYKAGLLDNSRPVTIEAKDEELTLVLEKCFRDQPLSYNIVNKTITINSIVRTVIGVMPERFNFPKGAEVYAPLPMTPELMKNRMGHGYYVIGRLKPGASIGSAQAEIDNISARLEQQFPETNKGWGATVFPIVADTVRTYDTALWVMMAAVGFVLLIACANVANLMLARASGRQREIAVRTALGASRWRIVRQLLTESVIVALIGGALGILIGFWGVDALRAANPGDAANRTADVLKLVVNHGMKLALMGIVIGLAGSWALTRFISKLLVGVEPTDLLTFSLVSLCLLVAAFVACYLPARRATKVDPLAALRYE